MEQWTLASSYITPDSSTCTAREATKAWMEVDSLHISGLHAAIPPTTASSMEFVTWDECNSEVLDPVTTSGVLG